MDSQHAERLREGRRVEARERKRVTREVDRRLGITEILVRVPARDRNEIRELARKRLEAYKREHGIGKAPD
jgi:hypothetical protein